MFLVYLIVAVTIASAYLSQGFWDPKDPWREIFAAIALGLSWPIWLFIVSFMGITLWLLLTFFED